MPQIKLNSLNPGGNRATPSCRTCYSYPFGPSGLGPITPGGGALPGSANQVELSAAVLGCTYDANEDFTGTVIVNRTADEAAGGITTEQLWYASGATVGVVYDPAIHGNYGPCRAGGSEAGSVEIVCKCDDVAGDGTNIVQYVEAYEVVLDNGAVTSTLIGTFDDKSLITAYAPVNPSDCDMLGVTATVKQGRQVLSGGIWSPPALAQSYTLRVAEIADPLNPPTFTDGFGTVTPLELGEVVSYGFNGDLIDTTAVVTANPGDRIVITFTELGA